MNQTAVIRQMTQQIPCSHVFIRYVICRFVDRENELREPKPATPPPPQRVPLDPWTKSRASQQWAGPKITKTSESNGLWASVSMFHRKFQLFCLSRWRFFFSLEVTADRIIQTLFFFEEKFKLYCHILYASNSPIEDWKAVHRGSLEWEWCISVLLIAVVTDLTTYSHSFMHQHQSCVCGSLSQFSFWCCLAPLINLNCSLLGCFFLLCSGSQFTGVRLDRTVDMT
jgi:hypothetical protein